MKCKQPKPSSLVVIKAIALADGKLKGSPYYMTKLQMIHLCKAWLKAKARKK